MPASAHALTSWYLHGDPHHARPAGPSSAGFPAYSRSGGNGADGCPLGGGVGLVIKDHADRPLAYLGGVSFRHAHGSILSRFGASGNPGTVHAHGHTGDAIAPDYSRWTVPPEAITRPRAWCAFE